MRLSEKQSKALRLAIDAETKAVDGLLVCAYGNRFFMAGLTDADGTAERNTLMSLTRLGLLRFRPGFTGRGEFMISAKGKELGS